jgi:hypothetical protein
MYPVSEEKVRRARGFLLTLLGVFAFVLSTIIVIQVTQQFVHLLIAALSLGSVILTYLAVKNYSISNQVIYLASAAIALAVEASSVMLYFPRIEAASYMTATLFSSFIALKGVRDIESALIEQPYMRKRREIPTMQEDLA